MQTSYPSTFRVRKNIRVANDLTKVERELEHRLYIETKELQSKEIFHTSAGSAVGAKGCKATKRPVSKRTDRDCDVNSCTVIEKLKCYYTNADQLRNKVQELDVKVRDQQPHIIWITEVNPKNQKHQLNPAEFSLQSGSDLEYHMFTKNIDNKTGRGMLLYVHKSLPATEVKMKSDFQENLFVKVQLNKKDELLIGLIYCSES
jgi:predicted metal-binding protein